MVTPNDRGLLIAVESSEPTGAFIPTREQPCPVMRERGVYMTNWFFNGNPVVIAVDSGHNVYHWAEWTEGQTYEAVVRGMRRWLDIHDPVGPRLVVE